MAGGVAVLDINRQFQVVSIVACVLLMMGLFAYVTYQYNQGLQWSFKACDELCLHSGHGEPVSYNFNNTCTCSDGWVGWFDR